MYRFHLSCLLALMLAACGGGGGGGGGSGTSTTSTPSSTGLTISFDTSSVSFNYVEGTMPAYKFITATATGTTDKDILMGAEVTGIGIALPIGVAIDTVARNASITIAPASGLAPGTYTGTIKLLACTTQDCKVQHGGSPHIVNYTVTVLPTLKVPQSSLSFAAVETGSPASYRVDFAAPVPTSQVLATVTYGSSTGGWLSAAVNGDHADVQVAPAGLAIGTYTATLTFTVQDTGQVKSMPVSLKVGGALSVADGADL